MDPTLVIAAQHGDEDAFAALVLGVGDRLYATAYRILRDRSLTEDVVQQTMLTAWRKLPRLRDPDRFVAWVFQIMVRAAYRGCARRAAPDRYSRLLPPHGSEPRRSTTLVRSRPR